MLEGVFLVGAAGELNKVKTMGFKDFDKFAGFGGLRLESVECKSRM